MHIYSYSAQVKYNLFIFNILQILIGNKKYTKHN